MRLLLASGIESDTFIVKKILVINSHLRKGSFCDLIFNSYVKGLKDSGAEFKSLNLREIDFSPFLKYDHLKPPILTKELKEIQDIISWSDHVVFIYPIWWSLFPAVLKIFFEIIFISGFAYKFKDSEGFIPRWDKLLKGKSVRIISTMDAPSWYYVFFLGDPNFKAIKSIMNFCGIKIVKKTYFGFLKKSSKNKREKYLSLAYKKALIDLR